MAFPSKTTDLPCLLYTSTSTAIFKTLIALKTRNASIISPHPRAKGCTIAASKLVLEAAVKAVSYTHLRKMNLTMNNTVFKINSRYV